MYTYIYTYIYMVPRYQIPIQYPAVVNQADPPFGPEVHKPSPPTRSSAAAPKLPHLPTIFCGSKFPYPVRPHPHYCRLHPAVPRLTTALTAAPCL